MKRGHRTIVEMVMAAFLVKGLIMNVGRETQLAIMDTIMTDQLKHQYVPVQNKIMNGIKYVASRYV
jgi:hypothetical protein